MVIRFYILLFAILGSFTFCVDGQTLPLKLRLTAPEGLSGCLGSKLDLSLTLTNVSNKAVVFERGRVGAWSVFEYQERGRTREDSFAHGEGPPSHYRPEYLILQPKESFSAPYSFYLDPEQFNKAGRYSLSIGYSSNRDATLDGMKVWTGNISSKEVYFLVKECKI